MGGRRARRGLCSLSVPWDPPSYPANFVCSLSPGFGGRKGTEWNRNSMWGTSLLIPTELAFPFLLLSCFSSLPAKLLVSLCSFLLCRLMFRINAGGVLCRAGGSPTCLCLPLPPSLSLALCLGEVPPCAAFRALLAGVEGPSSQKITVHLPCWSETRLGVPRDFLCPNS